MRKKDGYNLAYSKPSPAIDGQEYQFDVIDLQLSV